MEERSDVLLRTAGRVAPRARGADYWVARAGMGFGIGSLLGGMGNAADDMQSLKVDNKVWGL